MSKKHKAKPLKLVDTRCTYQTLRQIAAELHKEANQAELGPSPSTEEIDLSIALELARLQTKVADLREREREEILSETAAEMGKLENDLVGCQEALHKKDMHITHLTQWAKAWKKAATVNWRARKRLQQEPT